MTVPATPRPTGHPGYSETLPCQEASAQAARTLVKTALSAWQLEELTDTGVLLVTELVANAVKHTTTRLIRVAISRPSSTWVRIGVTDKSRILPHLKKANGDNLPASGRGLVLIDALTDRWGTDLYRWGKHVWADLKVEEQA
ncbi:ATP-binding protein [Streptomyces sp. NPDC056291]|uniref:ATP-binding protein n=1 Tax=Streptomyces sp. NPDC056291 TaxID=3345772 RepID=UPI0035D5992F